MDPVNELRVAVTADDYEAALRFYRDALGLSVVESWENEGGSGAVLDAGRATLEVLSRSQVEYVDRIEAGGQPSGPVRFALEVDDSEATAERLEAAGPSGSAARLSRRGSTGTCACALPTACSSPCSPSSATSRA